VNATTGTANLRLIPSPFPFPLGNDPKLLQVRRR
jgi:hypothetical protein